MGVGAAAFGMARIGTAPPQVALSLTLFLLALSPAGGAQYLSWVAPFALLAAGQRPLRVWTAATLPYLLVGYFGGIHYSAPTPLMLVSPEGLTLWRLLSLPSWVVLVAWAAAEQDWLGWRPRWLMPRLAPTRT